MNLSRGVMITDTVIFLSSNLIFTAHHLSGFVFSTFSLIDVIVGHLVLGSNMLTAVYLFCDVICSSGSDGSIGVVLRHQLLR